jgi:hypothetical protein
MIVMSLAPLGLAAQQPTGAIEGSVTDPQGAVVSTAKITARNLATGATRTVDAGEDGHYRILQLAPGNYEVKVTGEGFKTTVVSNVKVDVGVNVPLDIKMEVGGASETVTVTGGGEAQIDRTDNTVSGVVGAVQIDNLPLNGRNFLDLAQLQPGAEKVDGGTFDPTKANYTGVSIAGQAGRSTQITVDGGSVVDNVVGTTVQNFSQEIVQEFQIGISTFDLSTGASATGSVNIISKTGDNNFHGNGYIYWRDSSFSAFPSLDRLDSVHAVPLTAQVDQIPFDREQFGGTFSGPIKKDKAFFFFNTEYNNQDAVAIHVLPSRLPGFSGFTGSPFNELLITGRGDWRISDNQSFFGRYSHNDNDQQQPFAPGTGIVPRQSQSGIFQSHDQINTNRSDGVVVGHTWSISSNIVNDLRYGFNDFHNQIDPATPNFPAIWVLNDTTWRSGTNYITPQITNQSRNQVRDDLTWTKGKHTFRFGGDWERTSITGLFDFAKPARIRLYSPSTTLQTLVTEADFLNAPVRDISMGIGTGVLPFNTPEGATVNHRFQFYATHNWKVKSNFILNYGVAYRIDSNLWNHDQSRPLIVAPLFGKGTDPSPRDNNNIAPRVGFAWDLKGDGRTVIRGGFGMYYDTTIDNLRLFERADLGPPGAELFLVGADIQSNLLPGGNGRWNDFQPGADFIRLGQLLPILAAVRRDVESRAFNCTLRTSIDCFQAVSGPLFSTEFQIPYSLQYSIGVQKELPWKMLLQADYNYRKGVHEVLVYDANFVDSVDRNGNPTPRANFPTSVPYADSSAFSTYQALLLRVDRRFADGFQMTASYTLSSFKNFGGDALGLGSAISNQFSFKDDFGPGGLDRRHRLVISGLWNLPFFKDSDNGFKKQVLGNWSVSFISTVFSGLPLTAVLPDFVDLFGTGSFFSYLPGAGPGEIGRGISSVDELNAIISNYNANRRQFAARIEGGVPVDPFGTPLRELALLPANTPIGGDSIISQDVRVTKSFRFGESRRLDVIGEVFNLFNVANLTGVLDNVIPAREDAQTAGFEFTTFRSFSRTNNVFGTGGPRAFQFALKFTF